MYDCGYRLIPSPSPFSAGLFMAVAMASEMGFLGISFATAVAHLPRFTTPICCCCCGGGCCNRCCCYHHHRRCLQRLG